MKSNEFNPSELIKLLDTIREDIFHSAIRRWDDYTSTYICEENFHEAFETGQMFGYEREMMRQIDEQIRKLEKLKENM